MRLFHCVLCTDRHGVIGLDGDLAVRVPLDMERFRTLTKTPPVARTANQSDLPNAVLMGYTTWCSLPDAPLRGRVNIVLTRSPEHAARVRSSGGYPFTTVSQACDFVDTATNAVARVYVVGGASLYTHPQLRDRIHTVHWTHVDVDAAAAAPSKRPTRVAVREVFASSSFETVEAWTAKTAVTVGDTTRTTPVTFMTLRRLQNTTRGSLRASPTPTPTPTPSPSGEEQYLQVLRRVLEAPTRRTRNSLTRSVFGERMVVDLSDGCVPLVTSKRMAWKTVLRELFWFVRGDTDNAKLQAESVHIWDANASRAFLDSRGLTEREENDLGPVYGFQWRHFGAAYTDCHADYTGQGVDQLEMCRRQLVEDPHSRRILFTAWNPTDLPQMALPPCHLMGQWYVAEGDRLWLQVYQRSGDLFLGVPFNLFSYSALVHMMAHLTDTRPGGLVYVLGDAHIYEAHTDAVRTQLARPVHPPPRFRVREGCAARTWEAFSLEAFALEGYTSEGALRGTMVA